MKRLVIMLVSTAFAQEKPRTIVVKPLSVSLFAAEKLTFGRDTFTSNVGVSMSYRINPHVQMGGYYAHDPLNGTNGVTGIVSVKVWEYGRKRR